jgi:UDP-N-acetylglucosamine 2-epimerase
VSESSPANKPLQSAREIFLWRIFGTRPGYFLMQEQKEFRTNEHMASHLILFGQHFTSPNEQCILNPTIRGYNLIEAEKIHSF